MLWRAMVLALMMLNPGPSARPPSASTNLFVGTTGGIAVASAGVIPVGQYSARLEPAASDASTAVGSARHRLRHRGHRDRKTKQLQADYSRQDRVNVGRLHSAGQYEELCDTVTSTVHLNTRAEEFNPPFYVRKQCRYLVDNQRSGDSRLLAQSRGTPKEQKCGFGFFRCVQRYTKMHFSRRRAGGSGCWHPYSIEVHSGCECMWPVDLWGRLQHKEEL